MGQYSTSSAVFVCRVCKPAKYQSSAGQTSCVECNGCFAGSERRACGGSYEGYCVDCAPGWFVNSSKCLECPGGYYQTSLNQRNCTQCARCPGGGTRQQCGLSFEGYCAECIPGKFTSSTSGSEACQSCSAGQYQPDLDQSNCILCPAGKHQDEAGKPFCKEFKPGVQLVNTTVQTKSGTKTVMEEKQCPAGTFNDGSVGGMCISCPPGTVQPKGGRGQCLKCSVYQYQKLDETTAQPDNKTCVDRPLVGVRIRSVNGGGYQKIYEGGVWHSPSQLNANVSTNMYTCANEGCPDDGATKMACKPGYHGPICMVCNKGFYPQLRACVDCAGSGPTPTSIAIFVTALLLTLVLAASVMRHRRFLGSTGVFAHAKILVAFVTIMTTVDSQFGVMWPRSFKSALAALSLLSLDFGVLTSMMCAVRLSFYTNLIFTTMALVAVVVAIYFAHALMQRRNHELYHAHPEYHKKRVQIQQSCLFTAIYLLTFAYPVVSVKVVELFGCHNVEGATYLRADYSIECYTHQWNIMAAYSGIFLAVYVAGFPILVGAKLWSYRHLLQAQAQGPGQVCKVPPTGLLLGFLLDDYKLQLPCYMW